MEGKLHRSSAARRSASVSCPLWTACLPLQAARQQALQALEAALLLPSVAGKSHRQRLVIADDNMYYRQVALLGIVACSGPFATTRAGVMGGWLAIMHGCTLLCNGHVLAGPLTELSAHLIPAA